MLTKHQNTMRTAILMAFFCLSGAGAAAQQASGEQPAAPVNDLEFNVTEHDFGDIRQGDIVEFSFEFTNRSEQPLIISQVVATCGCTAPEWTREPVAPGARGNITIRFNSQGRLGRQHKIIAVRSNAPGPEPRLRISAMVLPPRR
jgi:hypothetical protein